MQCNVTNIIKVGYIQTYVRLTSIPQIDHAARARQGKWCEMFHTCIKLFPPTPVYACLYYISGQNWSTTHSAQNSQKLARRNINAIIRTMCHPGCYCNSLVATDALRHMMNNVATGTSCVQVHDLPHNHHCGNREGTLSS